MSVDDMTLPPEPAAHSNADENMRKPRRPKLRRPEKGPRKRQRSASSAGVKDRPRPLVSVKAQEETRLKVE